MANCIDCNKEINDVRYIRYGGLCMCCYEKYELERKRMTLKWIYLTYREKRAVQLFLKKFDAAKINDKVKQKKETPYNVIAELFSLYYCIPKSKSKIITMYTCKRLNFKY
jgi:hypothetical protein